ncbi:hypothetical protein PCASD_07284 [Puccinia coronata f. sp. avenae]|uniref:TFIIS N-terminal domain-containing protein n=1 Tax=Puccinia coronata f. sp. avenae TaxID=200324 RepID=A0A2N5URH8_9BASI|nr:hypothetical protein PCASD_07284 [Puccinia coronata f. sp. avenae]
MPRDLEDEIFGGESDLSDFGGDERPAAEGQQASLAGDDEQDGDYDGELPTDALRRETSQSFPKFKKDTRPRPSEESSAQGKHSHHRQKQSGPTNSGQDGGDEAEVTMNPDERRRLELYQQIDEAAGKGKKGKRRRRKGGDEDLDMMADEEVTRLRRKMMDAVEADCQANEERRPATAKLMLLPLVKATMQKSHLETAIIENGVLEAVKKWLEPLPDRSLPALNIQTELLDQLKQMSIDTQSLKSNELGKIVLFYTKCPRVGPKAKRMADELVTKWMRPILRRSASHRPRDTLTVPRPVRPQGLGGSSSSQRARIPEPVQHVFQVPARSQLDTSADAPSGSQNPAMRNSTQKATAKKTREWARKLQEARKLQRLG